MRANLRMKCIAAVTLLSLFSLGCCAPLNSCGPLLKPITISTEQMLGRWMYIGGSSNLPGSRSLGHLMTSVWLDITPTSQSNILNILQTQKIYGDCSSLTYDVTFENSIMTIEKPFYLREIYLPTNCSDCLVAFEEVTTGKDNFTSLMFFSRRDSVSPADLEVLRTQADCLEMASPIMIDKDNDICPDDLTPSEGLSALNSLLQAKMGHRVARLLDAFFDMFVN